MKLIAVILTVFNRKDITLKGFHTFYKAVDHIGPEYKFDIYMTDDGCTDGTSEAVKEKYPNVHIIQGNGSLYWSGGMRVAWNEAIKLGIDYDYYLWINDDADLYETSLSAIFKASNEMGDESIISGAFCDNDGHTSYGGRTKDERIVDPVAGTYKPVYLMNGNLTLIPRRVFKKLGNIHPIYQHSMGDWDYGCRAIKAGFKVVITDRYVGCTKRQGLVIDRPFIKGTGLCERLRRLYSPFHHPKVSWYFNINHMNLAKALKVIIIEHTYVLCPSIAIIIRKI